jgi:outer membrane protein assembly factor BamB
MSIAEAAPPIHRRPLLRVWFPLIVFVLAALAWIAVWYWPNDEVERDWRVGKIMAIISTSVLLWLIWLLFLSGWRWWLRLGLLAAIVSAAWGTLSNINVKFSGDVVPDEIRFPWEKSPATVLAEHREQVEKTALAPVQLPTGLTAEFPEYRGIRRDGIVQGPPLARDWKAQPPLLWRQPVGGGYAGFAVAGNLAVTIEQRDDKEAIVAYDTATGRERWVYPYKSLFFEPLGGDGPRATPTIAGGEVFALGAKGQLTCLRAATGEFKWSIDLLKDNGNIPWGMSGSPLIYDNVVVVNPGKQSDSASDHALIAYDRETGKEVWHGGNAQAAYASPMLADLQGQREILLFDAGGLAGYDATNGRELWRFPWTTYRDINVAQPVILPGNRIFISSGYGTGCALLEITSDGPQEIWRTKELRAKMTSPVFYQGHLYGMDDGILTCLDVATGRRKWRDGRYGHGQLLLSGDLLVIQAESGKLVLVEASPAGHRELGSIPVFSEKTWNCPALANGKVYLRNHKEMACYDLAAKAE